MILDLLRRIHDARRPTVIMATHSDRAALRGDYVVRIADGRVLTT
jgi:ABC-type lipoprotein export system ATPase subunit